MSLALIFLRGVVHFAQIRMAVKRVAIDGHFGVQAMYVTGRGDHQRVDFDQSHVFFLEHFGEAQENFYKLATWFASRPRFKTRSPPLLSWATTYGSNGGLGTVFGGFSGTVSTSTPPFGR